VNTWTASRTLRPARLRVADLARVGSTGIRTRPVRAALAALGIAIGVAAMIAVVGISVSSGAQVDRQLDALGTNLLQVTPGEDRAGNRVPLPEQAGALAARIGPVTSTAQLGRTTTPVYRNDQIPTGNTGGLAIAAASPDLLTTLKATVAKGRWLDAAAETFPAVVLGARAAEELGIVEPGTLVWTGGQWVQVIGILDPVTLDPSIDSTALAGWAAARTYLGFDGHPTTLYVRAVPDQLTAVGVVLPRQVSPTDAQYVAVERPTDAIAARNAATSALSGLLVGLGGVALLVGGVGIANTMIVSVMERRSEIGLRRALGATRGQIRGQFVTEALLLSLLGGLAGVLVGTMITVGYAASRGWPSVVPLWSTGGGLAATVLIGVVAGLWPAVRASRLSPTEALTAL